MTENETKHRPSALLLLCGLIAIAVSVLAFAGPSTWGTGTFDFGWIFVVGAVLVGLVMILKK